MNPKNMGLLSSHGNSLTYTGCREENVVFIDWSPGNGARYQMLFTRIPESVQGSMGVSPGSWLVTDLTHSRRSMVVVEDSLTHLMYVAEKLDLDAPHIQTVIINCVLDGDRRYAEEVLAQVLGSRTLLRVV
jgi:hypothetical protein